MKRIFEKWMAILAVLSGALLLTGCGEKTCFFVSPEAGEVETGAPVEWHNATIGTVKSVQPVSDGFRVDIVFDAAHADSVHDGVMAKVAGNPDFWPKPYVELLSGLEETRPVLGNGVRIPALGSDNVVQENLMRADDWLTGKNERYVTLVGALVAILTFFGKRIGAFLRNLLWLATLALVAYFAWMLHSDWESHRERFSNLKQGVIEFLEQNGEKVKNVGKVTESLDPLADDDVE